MFNLLMKSNRRRAKRRGFTLVELIIVIVILGILAGVAALSFTNVTQSSKDGVAKANLRALKSACQVYAVNNNGALPSAFADLDNYIDDALKTEIATPANGHTYALDSSTAGQVKLSVTGGGLTTPYELIVK